MIPSSSAVIMIWQLSREVRVTSKAKSSMSSSSSDFGVSLSYQASSQTRWQVAQASEPSHAASMPTSLATATSMTDRPTAPSTSILLPSAFMNIIFGMLVYLFLMIDSGKFYNIIIRSFAIRDYAFVCKSCYLRRVIMSRRFRKFSLPSMCVSIVINR